MLHLYKNRLVINLSIGKKIGNERPIQESELLPLSKTNKFFQKINKKPKRIFVIIIYNNNNKSFIHRGKGAEPSSSLIFSPFSMSIQNSPSLLAYLLGANFFIAFQCKLLFITLYCLINYYQYRCRKKLKAVIQYVLKLTQN